jgi:hypothetical protein
VLLLLLLLCAAEQQPTVAVPAQYAVGPSAQHTTFPFLTDPLSSFYCPSLFSRQFFQIPFQTRPWVSAFAPC